MVVFGRQSDAGRTSEMAGDVVPLGARRLAAAPVARQAEVLCALTTDVAVGVGIARARID